MLAVAVGLALAATYLLQGRPPPGTLLTRTPVVEAVLRDQGTPRVGPEDAEVVVVVFTDYRCPICRRTAPALERLIAADPAVRVHFKDWPILGEQSKLGARAALAAHRQGRYFKMHKALMADAGPLTPARVAELAGQVGLDAERLASDLQLHAGDIDEQLNRQANQAFSLGLRGTPAYLVGPFLIEGGLDDRALAKAVAAARKAGPL